MNKTHRFLYLCIASFVSVLTFFLLSDSASAAFNKNYLMDDNVFNNENSMSAAQIDIFLNKHQFSCISPNSGFRAIEPTGYSPSGGFAYGGFVTAGHVIHAAAQAYNINPRVLIATLEKEQSLVTGRNSSSYCSPGNGQHKYAAAMGYGCPDSGSSHSYSGVNLYRRGGTTYTSVGSTCVNSSNKAGFSQQIIRGAWLLKFGQQRSQGRVDWAIIEGNWDNADDLQSCYSGPMTQGTFRRCPSGSAVYYDGLRSIDGQTVRMSTGATAALYWYTPHLHGNQLFTTIYENWFGPVISTPFFRINNQSAIYVLGANNSYYHVPSWTIMRAYGWGEINNKVASFNSGFLSSKTFRGNLPVLARFEGDEIYLMDKGLRRHFTSRDVLNNYGYDIGDEAQLPSDYFTYFRHASLMRDIARDIETGRVYLLTDARRRHFTGQGAYKSGNPKFSSLPRVDLSKEFLESRPYGAPIYPTGHLIRVGSDPRVYIISNYTQKAYVPSKTVLDEFGLSFNNVRSVSQAAANAYTTITNNLDTVIVKEENGGTRLVMFGKEKYAIPPSMARSARYNIDPSNTVTLNFNTLKNYSALGSITELIRVRGESPVYLVESGKKRYVTSPTALHDLGYTFDDVSDVSRYFANKLSTGQPVE